MTEVCSQTHLAGGLKDPKEAFVMAFSLLRGHGSFPSWFSKQGVLQKQAVDFGRLLVSDVEIINHNRLCYWVINASGNYSDSCIDTV